MTDLRIQSLVREALRSPATDTQPDLRVQTLVREVLRSPSVDTQPDLRIQSLVRECLRSPRGPTTPHVKKAKFTVQSSKVTGASISNYVVFLTEQHLPASIFNSTYGARSDGGDIRAYNNSAAATEYPIDVVIFDKVNSKALICVKLPSVGSGANTDFYLFWGWPALAGYAAGDPYGQWNVWIDYSFVAFFNGTTLTADRTSGARAFTFAGSPSAVDGPYSKATRFNGTTGSMIASSTTIALGTEVTITVVAKRVGNGDANARITTARAGAATQGLSLNLLTGASDALSASIYTSGGVETSFGSHAMGAGWNEIVLTSNTVGPAHELFVGDVSRATNAAAVRATTTAGRMAAASSLATSGNENAQVDISMILIEPRIDANRKTTGKSNRDDPGFVDTTVEHYSTISMTAGYSADLAMPVSKTLSLSSSPAASLETELTEVGGVEHELSIELETDPVVTMARSIEKLIDVEAELDVALIRDMARVLAMSSTPAAALDLSVPRQLELSTSPIAQLAHQAAKEFAEQCDMELTLERATSKTFALTTGPVAFLVSGRQFLKDLAATAGFDVLLERSISKALDLSTTPAIALSRAQSLLRTITVNAAVALGLRRDTSITLELETTPTASLGLARSIARTLTTTARIALDLILGPLQGEAITDRVLRIPPENRIIRLARSASRILKVPPENRLARIARELRLVKPTPENRIVAIPAEGSRVISVPPEDRVLPVPPES